MENRMKYIIIAVVAIIAIILFAGLAVVTSSTLYKDSNIEVEVPYGTQFNITETIDVGIAYNSNTGVEIDIDKPNNQDTHDQLKKQFKEQYNAPMDQDKYNGQIYNKTENDDTTYITILYFDNEKSIVTLKAKNLDTLIKMAKTFKLAEGFNNAGWDETNTTSNETNGSEKNINQNSVVGNNEKGRWVEYEYWVDTSYEVFDGYYDEYGDWIDCSYWVDDGYWATDKYWKES
jgi:hypothetical protein